MKLPRSAGILLHPTSLPSPHGIGDLGRTAHKFVDILAAAQQRWWQMLPLNAPGYGGSPYSAESAFAGNPALIDLQDLVVRDWLEASDVAALESKQARRLPATRVDFGSCVPHKLSLLAKAFHNWRAQDGPTDSAFQVWREEQDFWLEEYILFAALKERFDNASWRDWPDELVRRDEDALTASREDLQDVCLRHAFMQWIFAAQWSTLREHAHQRGVRLIGDIPIFVAMDSADVWSNRHLFKLDADGRTDVVAGVPPDYFSETGQKWGNPVYDWDAVADNQYAWWIERVRHATSQVDMVRIDHFRGFQDYWETPADEPTAMNGEWVEGPRDAFFEAIADALGEVPFIAEDLGDIDDAVYELRDRHDLPGMKVMQFAFSGEPDHPFLPHTYPAHCVAYTGTHDNDTTRGWYDAASDAEKHRVRTYVQAPDNEVVEALIERLFESKAALTIIPAQDLWELGTDARMNTPATTEDNWSWRMTGVQLNDTATWAAHGKLTAHTMRGAATGAATDQEE